MRSKTFNRRQTVHVVLAVVMSLVTNPSCFSDLRSNIPDQINTVVRKNCESPSRLLSRYDYENIRLSKVPLEDPLKSIDRLEKDAYFAAISFLI